jgi:hypothetical protein
MEVAVIINYVIPILKVIIYLAIGLGGVVGLAYYLFVIKRRRVWIVHVWEDKADGRLNFVGVDKIIEKKINKGKQIIYVMKQARSEVFPPPTECTYYRRGKEYCNYLRLRENEFQPLTRTVVRPDKTFFDKFRKERTEFSGLTKAQIEDKYIYAPMNNLLTVRSKFEAMDYDINMMRINAIDNRDKMYADQKSFFEKYGSYVVIGSIIVLIIVVLYLSFDYVKEVMRMGLSAASPVADNLGRIADAVGGVPPPQ